MNVLHIILLSGGSGKRLWPLSNDSRSKQFLKVLLDEQNKQISMVQRIWKQLKINNLSEHTIISTCKSQVDMINSQLSPDIPLVVEPSRRDTYPAITLASMYLSNVLEVNQNEVVIVLPVDLYVEDEFFQHLKKLEKIIQNKNADLALIGIQPTFPTEKYGYIVPKSSHDLSIEEDFQKVRCFVEKPNQEKAKQLMTEKALWNSGVFAFKLEFLLNNLVKKGLPQNFDEMIEQYNRIPKTSFDYEIVEKTNNIIVAPYQGEWKDLGTWNTLTEEINSPLIGKGIISSDCINVHVINELDIPVSILGLSNLIVAASPDGILVSDKESSSRVKEIAAQFDYRPMYEERRWGWYRVLDYTKFHNSHEVLTKRICIAANKNLSYQKHFHRTEVWNIISGKGLFALNEKIWEVNPGDVLKIPVGASHSIKAITDLEFIEVQTGTELIEEDIVRIFMTWKDIVNYCSNRD